MAHGPLLCLVPLSLAELQLTVCCVLLHLTWALMLIHAAPSQPPNDQWSAQVQVLVIEPS